MLVLGPGLVQAQEVLLAAGAGYVPGLSLIYRMGGFEAALGVGPSGLAVGGGILNPIVEQEGAYSYWGAGAGVGLVEGSPLLLGSAYVGGYHPRIGSVVLEGMLQALLGLQTRLPDVGGFLDLGVGLAALPRVQPFFHARIGVRLF
ncbi:MAG: hypothetical protein QXM53_07745 [Thermofilaceae archaeon]